MGILCASERPLSLEALPVGGGQEALARNRQNEAFSQNSAESFRETSGA